MKVVAHTIMEEEINKEDNREFSKIQKSIYVLLWKFNQKRLKKEQKMYWKKKQLWKIVLINKIFKKKKKITLKNMPDCGR